MPDAPPLQDYCTRCRSLQPVVVVTDPDYIVWNCAKCGRETDRMYNDYEDEWSDDDE